MSDSEEVIVYDNGEGADLPLIERINQKLNMELADPKALSALIATTFNGMDATRVKQAMMEGMIRGFKFEDFLHKNVYAIPYGQKYSLVTSIDHARKVGMRSGVVGKSAPVYTFTDVEKTKVDTCEITIKRVVNGHIAEFTALVYDSEYNTGQNLWKSKPKTMIAKVAEMHALRMACPEEMAAMYTEEEMHKEVQQPNRREAAVDSTQNLTMGSLTENNDNNTEVETPQGGESEAEVEPTTESNQE